MTVRSTSAARETMLGKIRKSVGVSDDAHGRRVAIQKRLYDHDAHIIPARAQLARAELLTQFQTILEGQSATVSRVQNRNEIPALLAGYLREHNLPARIRHGLDRRLADMDWSRAPHIDRLMGPAHPSDAIGLSHAYAAASETGTLFLVSGGDNPTTLNFLPETHIVVVNAADVAGPYEGAWARIRDAYGERTMPRTVNLISGPSRTADIEQVIVMGAHGPRRLHVIVVENA